MQGIITGRHVLTHPTVIIRGFGVGCYLRCIRAVLRRERTTFLELISRATRACTAGR